VYHKNLSHADFRFKSVKGLLRMLWRSISSYLRRYIECFPVYEPSLCHFCCQRVTRTITTMNLITIVVPWNLRRQFPNLDKPYRSDWFRTNFGTQSASNKFVITKRPWMNCARHLIGRAHALRFFDTGRLGSPIVYTST